MSGGLYWIRSILFPGRCMLCRRFLAKQETSLCHNCRTLAPVYPYGVRKPDPEGKIDRHFLDSFTAVWYYEGDVRSSILRFKFRKAIHLAPKFGALLGMKLLEQGPEQIDVLTWVPVSTFRRFQRGYDQCELLAKALGEELSLPHRKVLRKIRNTPPQSRLTSASARRANILGAYKVVKNVDLQGKRVLLLDDIYTTGATMNECARVLLTAGAKEVHGIAIAAVRHQKK